MPRYDDRYGNTRLYVGHLSSRTRSRDLDYLFSKYGRFLGPSRNPEAYGEMVAWWDGSKYLPSPRLRVRDVDMKRDYAFVEFSDSRDADEARYYLDGREFDGSRLIVEFAKGVPRGSREYMGRGPPPGSGRCFNCGIDGHWARDCKAGDWKNKCYRCGERGHIERNCTNSPQKLKRGRSYSPSPRRSLSPRRYGSRSPSYSRRSYSLSRSRSPPPKRERSIEKDDRSVSPVPRSRSRSRNLSLSPEEGSPRASPKARDYSPSPRGRSGSPDSRSPVARGSESPPAANGRSRSLSPRDDRSPAADDYDDKSP